MGFHHVAQAGLEHLTPDNLPASASQIAGIPGVSNHTWPHFFVLWYYDYFQVLSPVLGFMFPGVGTLPSSFLYLS